MLDATVSALLDLGVEGVTIEDLTARSGVAKSTIYRHFGSREALLSEAVEFCIVEYPTPDSGSLADDLVEIFGHYDEPENQQVNELFPLIIDAARRDPEMQAVMARLLVTRQRPLRTVIQLAQLRGEVDPALDLDVALSILIGPLNYRRMVQDQPIDDAFITTVLAGAVAALRATALSPRV